MRELKLEKSQLRCYYALFKVKNGFNHEFLSESHILELLSCLYTKLVTLLWIEQDYACNTYGNLYTLTITMKMMIINLKFTLLSITY